MNANTMDVLTFLSFSLVTAFLATGYLVAMKQYRLLGILSFPVAVLTCAGLMYFISGGAPLVSPLPGTLAFYAFVLTVLLNGFMSPFMLEINFAKSRTNAGAQLRRSALITSGSVFVLALSFGWMMVSA